MLNIPWKVEDELGRYFAGEHLGPMGLTALPIAERVQTSGRAGDIGDQAVAMSAWSRAIEARLRKCSTSQRAMLTAAFGPMTFAGWTEGESGLAAYGQLPNAVLACPEAMMAARGSEHALPVWLMRKARVAQGIPADGITRNPDGSRRTVSDEDQLEAAELVEGLRHATEQRLAEALQAYGADVVVEQLPSAVSLRELATVLGVDHHTAAAYVEARRVPVRRTSAAKNAKMLVNVSDLQTYWPEAASRFRTIVISAA